MLAVGELAPSLSRPSLRARSPRHGPSFPWCVPTASLWSRHGMGLTQSCTPQGCASQRACWSTRSTWAAVAPQPGAALGSRGRRNCGSTGLQARHARVPRLEWKTQLTSGGHLAVTGVAGPSCRRGGERGARQGQIW